MISEEDSQRVQSRLVPDVMVAVCLIGLLWIWGPLLEHRMKESF